MKVGDAFKGGRYTVLQKLGWGHFSTVWLVSDRDTGGHAALKVCPQPLWKLNCCTLPLHRCMRARCMRVLSYCRRSFECQDRQIQREEGPC